MRITIRHISGKSYILDMKDDATVQQTKVALAYYNNLQFQSLEFLFNGRKLHNNEKISQIGYFGSNCYITFYDPHIPETGEIQNHVISSNFGAIPQIIFSTEDSLSFESTSKSGNNNLKSTSSSNKGNIMTKGNDINGGINKNNKNGKDINTGSKTSISLNINNISISKRPLNWLSPDEFRQCIDNVVIPFITRLPKSTKYVQNPDYIYPILGTFEQTAFTAKFEKNIQTICEYNYPKNSISEAIQVNIEATIKERQVEEQRNVLLKQQQLLEKRLLQQKLREQRELHLQQEEEMRRERALRHIKVNSTNNVVVNVDFKNPVYWLSQQQMKQELPKITTPISTSMTEGEVCGLIMTPISADSSSSTDEFSQFTIQQS